MSDTIEQLTEKDFRKTEVLRKLTFWSGVLALFGALGALCLVFTSKGNMDIYAAVAAVPLAVAQQVFINRRKKLFSSMRSRWSKHLYNVAVFLPSGEMVRVVDANEFGTRVQVKFSDGFVAWHHGGHLELASGGKVAPWFPSYVTPTEALLDIVLPLKWNVPDGRIGIVRDAKREKLRDGRVHDVLLLKVENDQVKEYLRSTVSAHVPAPSDA